MKNTDTPNENAITIAQELFPLVKDCFVGKFELDGNRIILRLLNDENYIISIKPFE